ncbi:trypsin 5G1-like [Cimex lectularius]|uniref:Peptidase S1 domain-containing protein n=1 Tax=Cimex lectularius TaxID=79782 RepID=A0A8I6TDT5_CIMLE|nr:trypsin 5G1-like [Cimex lectularius]
MNHCSFLIFICLLSYTVSQYQDVSLPGQVGDQHNFSALKKMFSFTVSIQNLEARLHICVGTVITALHVLTVCHCTGEFYNALDFKPFNISTLVVVGGDVSAGRGQARLIREMHRHEKCDDLGFGYSHDYGLLVLKEKFFLTDSLRAISIRQADMELIKHKTFNVTDKQNCYVASWGEQRIPETNHKIFTIVKIFDITLLTFEECEAALCKSPKWRCIHNLQDRKQICGLGKNGDVCRGDSGSPLLCSNYIYGMVAWGPTCGEMSYPSVYANMYEGLRWSKRLLQNSGTPGVRKAKLILSIVLHTFLRLKIF